jgi:23S rRNA (adenine1618-N6)-methyltransferase
MSMSDQKHFCRINDKPNFDRLCKKYPEKLGKFYINRQFNWSNENVLIALTETLLLDYYNIDITLQLDRLCPPIPNRYNYLKWLSQIFHMSKDSEV